MPWYMILFLVLSFLIGLAVLAFIYFGLIKPGSKDSLTPPAP